MAGYLKCLGLRSLVEEEGTDALTVLICRAVGKGKEITGYYGLPYINHHYGDVQFICRTGRREDGGFRISGLDTHCKGVCVWDLQIFEDMTADRDPLARKLMLKGKKGGGLFIADVFNADVLPSFSKDEPVRLQMIAYAYEIDFYENEEEYKTAAAMNHDGKKYAFMPDSLFPIGLLSEDDDPEVRQAVMIHGTVTGFMRGTVQYSEDGEAFRPYIYCKVKTQFGELEIVADVEAMKDDQLSRMHTGAVAGCVAWLCGDAGIYERDGQIVRDAENNLRLIRYTLEKGDPERLRSVLADRFVFHSENSGKHFEDADETIAFIRKIHTDGTPCEAFYATIKEYTGEKEPEYPVGTRCLVLKYEDEEGFNAIVFADTDKEGNLTRILLSKDSGYRFKTDEPLPDRDQTDE